MASCEKCWREYKETIHTDIGIYHYCGFHAKQLKDSLDPSLYY
jgi:hypothetical protein